MVSTSDSLAQKRRVQHEQLVVVVRDGDGLAPSTLAAGIAGPVDDHMPDHHNWAAAHARTGHVHNDGLP